MELMMRRGVLTIMGANSSNKAVVNDSTKSLEMGWTDTTGRAWPLNRLFHRCPLKVLYIGGVIELNAGYFFEHMYALKAAIFPDVTNVSANYIFWTAEKDKLEGSYTAIDFHKTVTISSTCPFRLDGGGDIILRSDGLSTTKMTSSTWGQNKDMKFYVPQSLLSAYRQAENWNTFDASNYIAIEGSKYENVNWWKFIQ